MTLKRVWDWVSGDETGLVASRGDERGPDRLVRGRKPHGYHVSTSHGNGRVHSRGAHTPRAKTGRGEGHDTHDTAGTRTGTGQQSPRHTRDTKRPRTSRTDLFGVQRTGRRRPPSRTRGHRRGVFHSLCPRKEDIAQRSALTPRARVLPLAGASTRSSARSSSTHPPPPQGLDGRL